MKDKTIYALVKKEEKRQKEGIELIPSENYASSHVRTVLSSYFVNKYSEGYPKKRYYGGNENVDVVEIIAQERAKKLFKVPFANVQPYSGSPANLAVCLATCRPGDTLMGQALTAGGHLTHGHIVSATGIFYKAVQYSLKATGIYEGKDLFDYKEIRRLAKANRPKLIWVGATAYPLKFNYKKFAEIADEVGAYLAADIAHVSGLIAGGSHPSPVPYVHIVTTTTHKTLRGPRGGMIMVTEKGIKKDPDLPAKIDKAIFPGLQGGPHDHQTAAIAIALQEASSTKFKKYAHQIVKNAKALASSLKESGLTLVGDGSENHLILLDLAPVFGAGGGVFASDALEAAGMTANKNTIPKDPGSPFYPSGVRLGTPALTTRGMKEAEMKKVGEWIARAIHEVNSFRLPTESKERAAYLETFRAKLSKNAEIKKIRKEIQTFCKKYPLPHLARK